MIRRRVVAFPIAVAFLAVHAVTAQTIAPPTPPAGYFISRLTSERWISAGQRAESVPVLKGGLSTRIDSIGQSASGHTLYLNTGNQVIGQFTIDPQGRTAALSAGLRPRPLSTLRQPPEEVARSARYRLFESAVTYRVALPEARIWDLAFSFHPDRLATGGRWVDSLTFEATTPDGFQQSLRGIRRFAIVGDTTMAGRRMWIVRDSAVVTYHERYITEEEVANTLLSVERIASGTLQGRYLFDPELGLLFSRADTTALTGTESVSYPDGRVFHTTVRYERTRVYLTEDSLARKARLDAARPVRASIADMQAATANPKPAASAVLAAGDTAAALELLARGVPGFGQPITLADMRLAVLAMADPARALSWRANLDYLYGDISGHIMRALPALTPDSTKWGCEPAACRFLASQWENAREPRLRDLGLLAHMVLDPVRWRDSVLAHKAQDPNFSKILNLTRGVGATWPAATHAPIPPVGAAWPAWVDWMNGHNPAYGTLVLPGRDTSTALAVRFETSHLQAIQFQQLLTGRDFATEFTQRLASATSDSARLVFRIMAIALGAYHGDVSDIAARIASGTSVERNSASREVVALFAKNAPLADSATTVSLQDKVLSALFLGEPFLVAPSPGGRSAINKSGRPGDSLFIQGAELLPALRAKWSRSATIITDPKWVPPREKMKLSVYRVSAVKQVGPFATVTFEYSYWTPGASPAPSPGSFATGATFYLMRSDTGWVIVSASTWIT